MKKFVGSYSIKKVNLQGSVSETVPRDVPCKTVGQLGRLGEHVFEEMQFYQFQELVEGFV